MDWKRFVTYLSINVISSSATILIIYLCVHVHSRLGGQTVTLLYKHFYIIKLKYKPWNRHHLAWGYEDTDTYIYIYIYISYTLSREYRVVRNQYSRLLFTSEDRLCANLRVQEQSMNLTSQCQHPTFAWRHRSNCGDVTMLGQKRSSLAPMARSAIDNSFSGIVCSGHK